MKSIDARQMIMKLSSGHILARAIHVAARFKLADYINGGITSVEHLAEKVDADTDALYRLLRLLSSYGIFKEDSDKKFALTSLSEPLLSDNKNSLRSWLAYHDGDPDRWNAYGHMEYAVQTGQSSFEMLFDEPYFNYISQNYKKAQGFDEGMANLSQDEDIQIVQVYDFSGAQKVADVGGGYGGLLAEILKKYEQVEGMLCELEHVIEGAQGYLRKQQLEDRTECISGSFFDEVPVGADIYILKRILHDWNDEQCVTILKNCVQAMKVGSRLLIIETVLAGANERDYGKDVDIAMLVLFGGRERTRSEWDSLLDRSGLKIVQLHKTPSMMVVIEAVLMN